MQNTLALIQKRMASTKPRPIMGKWINNEGRKACSRCKILWHSSRKEWPPQNLDL